MMTHDKRQKLHADTRLIHDSNNNFSIVATPVYHASTVLFESYEELQRISANPADRGELYYGRMGTPTTRSLEDAISDLDDSAGALLSTSGLAATAEVLQCLLQPGDHLLMVDSCYGPTRNICLQQLASHQIETTFYPPTMGADIEKLVRENTRLIYMESPGSATFEVQDVPAIVEVARQAGITTAIDNTWATPLLFNPLDHGVDIAIQSGTKYLNGHADVMFGAITSRSEQLLKRLSTYKRTVGSHLAPDDSFLARRGLRTLSTRLERHQQTGMALANWFLELPQTRQLLHPAFESCPGHQYFKRDFSGANGLFAVVLEGISPADLATLLNSLQLFGMGYSWGGFESLVLPMIYKRSTDGGSLGENHTLLRVHAGLENANDLIADLERGFALI